MHNSQSGFVALLSVVIIGAMLTVYVFTLGTSSFFSRFSALDAERKAQSRALTDACTEVAIARMARDDMHAVLAAGECVPVTGECGAGGSTGTCKICAISQVGSIATIFVRAVSGGAYTDMRTVVDMSQGFSIVDREETPRSEISTCTLP